MTLIAWLFALGLTVPVAAIALVIGRKGAHAAAYWTSAVVLTALPLALALTLPWLAATAPATLQPLTPVMSLVQDLPVIAENHAPSSGARVDGLGLILAVWLVGVLVRAGVEARRSLKLTCMTSRAERADARLEARVRSLGEAMKATPAGVYVHEGAVMVTGLIHPRLYLNAAALTSPALDPIIRHELAHMRRRDVGMLSFARLLGVALWFNPFFFAVEARRRLAAELDCDRHALAGHSKDSARSYARALIHAAGSNSGSSFAVGFGVAPKKAIEMRLTSILSSTPKRGSGRTLLRASVLSAGVLVFGGVQAANATGVLTPPDFTAVLLEGRDTSDFGPRVIEGLDVPPFHGGHDIAAPLGSPVRAPAAGRITYAGDEYNGNADWGYVVEIDHGGGWTTLYAHLSGSMYGRGEELEAGQIFATVGVTGLTTGPHLHVEVRENGERRDPTEHLPGLARLTD